MTNIRNQTSLGLPLKLHHKFGSKELLQLLCEHGLGSPYDEIMRFKESVASYTSSHKIDVSQMLSFSSELGPAFFWCDNLDLNIHSPNGRRFTHVMVTEFMQHLPSAGIVEGGRAPGVLNLTIPRLTKGQAVALQLPQSRVALKHSYAPKKVNPPNPNVTNPTHEETAKLEDALKQCHDRDAAWWCQTIRANAIEWSGWNVVLRRNTQESPQPRTMYMFGPVVDAPPAHPDTVLTTMHH